jgi:hypothetical protein
MPLHSNERNQSLASVTSEFHSDYKLRVEILDLRKNEREILAARVAT